MTPEERDRLAKTEQQLDMLHKDVSEIQKDVRSIVSLVSEVQGAVRFAFVLGAIIVGGMNIANIVVNLWLTEKKTISIDTGDSPLTIEKAPDKASPK